MCSHQYHHLVNILKKEKKIVLRVADWDCHGVVQLFCTNTKHGSNAGESFQNEAWSPDLQPVRDGMLILACLCGYGQAPFEGPTQYCSPHCQPRKYHPELVWFWQKLFLVTCSYLRNFRFCTTIRGLHYTYQGAFTIGPYHKKEWHTGAFNIRCRSSHLLWKAVQTSESGTDVSDDRVKV